MQKSDLCIIIHISFSFFLFLFFFFLFFFLCPPELSGVATGVARGAECHPWQRKNLPKRGKKREKIRKNREEKAKIRRFFHFAHPDRYGWLHYCLSSAAVGATCLKVDMMPMWKTKWKWYFLEWVLFMQWTFLGCQKSGGYVFWSPWVKILISGWVNLSK